MMNEPVTLLNPTALVWCVLIVPVVIFYLWVAGPRRHCVGTGMLWRQVFGTERASGAWCWGRHLLSLVIQVGVVLLVVLAVAEPDVRGPRDVILVVDNSASMNATDVQPTRLDRARHAALETIGQLRYRDRMAVVTAGGPVAVQCGLTGRREVLEEAIRKLPATRGPTSVMEAVQLARGLLAGRSDGLIVVVSDGCFEGAAGLAEAKDVRVVAVGGAGENAAITRLVARRVPGDPLRCQLLAEVASFTDHPVTGRLEIAVDNTPVETVAVKLAAGGRWQRTFELRTADGCRFTARLDRPDVFMLDNSAAAVIGPRPVHQVRLEGQPSDYLQKVLHTNPLARLAPAEGQSGAARERKKAGAMVVHVFHQKIPSQLPAGPALVVDPQDACNLWTLGDPIDDPTVARQDSASPVLRDVRLEGLRLAQARRLVPANAPVESLPSALAAAGPFRNLPSPLAGEGPGVRGEGLPPAVASLVSPKTLTPPSPRGRGGIDTLTPPSPKGRGGIDALTPPSPKGRGGIDIAAERARAPAEHAAASARPLAWTEQNVGLVYAFDRPDGRVLVVLGSLDQGDLATDSAFPIFMQNALDWVAGVEQTAEPQGDRGSFSMSAHESSDIRSRLSPTRKTIPDPFGAAVPPGWVFLGVAAGLVLVAEWCLFQRRWTA